MVRGLRLGVGMVFVFLGILGAILPIMPATPFFLLASLVLGKHSRLARQSSIWGKRLLRRLAAHEQRVIRFGGRLALRLQRDTSCRMRRINRWLGTRQSNVLRRFTSA